LTRLGANEVLPAVIIDLPDLGGSRALSATGADPFVICAFAGH
jgi:adenine phosphoribosyltransferase